MRRRCAVKFSTHCSELLLEKLQYITGVRPDLMFATKCLSYKLASPTLADLTRAKKALRYLKGTRELNLYLTTPALKPNDLNKTLKHATGYSDADWAAEQVTRKSTSCTLWYIDQFLLTSELPRTGNCCLVRRRIRTVCVGCTVSCVDFRTSYPEREWTTIPERDWTIIPDTRETRQKHSTRSGNETRSESKDETRSHEFLFHSSFGISDTADDVISQE